MAESVFDRIALIEGAATKQEKEIISVIYKEPPSKLCFLNISEFAAKCGVADSTLLRFCRKLRLKGYAEFRMLMAQSQPGELEANSENEESFAALKLKAFSSALSSTFGLNDESSIAKAAEIVLEADKVYVLGSGNSGLAAEELRNKLLRFGLHAFTLADSHLQSIAVSTLSENDAAIFFSVSGSTLDILGLAENAKKRGVRIVTVTNSVKSPLSIYADVPLYIATKSAPLDGGSLIAKASQLYLIDVLSAVIFSRMGENGENNLRLTAEAVLAKEI